MVNEIATCTIASFPLTLLGVTGFVASIFALVLLLMPSRHARKAAAAAVAVGVFALAFGVIARQRMDAAVERARGQVSDDAVAFGHLGAITCGRIGFQVGMMPITAGLVVFVVSASRRRKGDEHFVDDEI